MSGQDTKDFYAGLFLGHGKSYSPKIVYYGTGGFVGGVQGNYYFSKKSGIGLAYEFGYHDIYYHTVYPELSETQSHSIEASYYMHFKDTKQDGFYIQFSLYPSFNKTNMYIVDSTYIPHTLGGYYRYDYRTESKIYPFRIPAGITVGYNIELQKRRIFFAVTARQDIQKTMLYDTFLGLKISLLWKLKSRQIL
jgi:hypothetical protein